MTRFSIPAARTVGGGAVVFLMSISIYAVSRYGAQAEPRFQCPRGQIYRVSKHICVSKQSNLGYLPSTRKKDAIAASTGARRDVLGPVSPHSAPQISSVDRSSAAGENPPVEEAITPRIQQSEPVNSPHADLESNLGAVLQAPTERQSGTAKLEDLVAAYRDALKQFIRERAPLDWAMTQSDLGNALAILGEREGRTATLEEAVTVYREALKEFTRERAPLQWATIQNNLGAALATIGEEGSGTLRLEEAVVAYREALKERTRDRAPLDWAMSTGNQGVTLKLLAERLGNPDMAKRALGQIDVAFTALGDGGHAPFAAYYEAQLPKARALVGRLSQR